MSLIDESGQRYVRMAYLATVGSHKVNGVAELHSQLLKETTLHDFFELWPEKFHQHHQRRYSAPVYGSEQSSPLQLGDPDNWR